MANEIKKLQITEEIRKQLNAPLPAEAISKHPTKTFLSTIKSIFIIERLNSVFKLGGWHLSTEIIKETPDYVLVKGELKIHDYDVKITPQFGGHNTTGKGTEIADGYKSAVTDCLSKCASYLEIGIDVFKGKSTPAQSYNSYSKPAYTPKLAQQQTTEQQMNNQDKKDLTCTECLVEISVAEYEFSKKKFGKALCRNCQGIARGNE